MHQSANEAARLFFQVYADEAAGPLRVLDVGSYDVNGSLAGLVPAEAVYTGVDVAAGPGVDVVLDDAGRLPFAADAFDLVVSAAHFEHDRFFWLSFLEIFRVLRPGGLFYLDVPSNGWYQRRPADHWRFYPDAGKALEAWAGRNGLAVSLLESFVLPQFPGEPWNDFVAVFRKGSPDPADAGRALHARFPGAANIWVVGASYPVAENNLPEDRRLLAELEYKMEHLLDAAPRGGQPAPAVPVCNLCSGTEFGPGPNGRMADNGLPPHCLACGSLERQRIIRRVMQSLPIGFLDWRRGLQFSRDNANDPKWFRSYEISVFGGDNSLDLQDIDREAGSYDFITCNHVLEFVPDARRAFAEMLRLLAPAGFMQMCFSAPLLREASEDFDRPFGPHEAWHLFGRDLADYFDCAARGVLPLAVEESDPATGVREVVHLFTRQPGEAMRMRAWLSVWSATATVLP